jgi:hypothetical protein
MNEAIISGVSVTALVDRLAKSSVFEHLFAGLRALRHPDCSLASIVDVSKRGPGHEGPKLAREAASGAAGARAFLLQMR